MRSRLLAALLLLSAASPARAEGTSAEFWPELQFHYLLPERTKLIGMFAVSRARDEAQPYQAEIGLTGERWFTDWFRARLGYRHANAVDGGAFSENRLLIEQIFRLNGPLGIYADFRTREDLRWLNSGFSARIRERVQVQRDFDIDGRVLTPYVSFEAYYDTRYDQVSRYRAIGGVTLSVGRHFAIEPYYAYQVDVAPAWSATYAIGLLLTTTF